MPLRLRVHGGDQRQGRAPCPTLPGLRNAAPNCGPEEVAYSEAKEQPGENAHLQGEEEGHHQDRGH